MAYFQVYKISLPSSSSRTTYYPCLQTISRNVMLPNSNSNSNFLKCFLSKLIKSLCNLISRTRRGSHSPIPTVPGFSNFTLLASNTPMSRLSSPMSSLRQEGPHWELSCSGKRRGQSRRKPILTEKRRLFLQETNVRNLLKFGRSTAYTLSIKQKCPIVAVFKKTCII